MIYRSLLILSFIAVNGLILFGISQTLSFLNTGADRSGMLHVGIKNKQAYTPSVKWKDTTNPGRPIEKQTMYEIQKDYINSWYVRNVAYKEYDSLGVFDFYTFIFQSCVILFKILNNSAEVNEHNTTGVDRRSQWHRPLPLTVSFFCTGGGFLRWHCSCRLQ